MRDRLMALARPMLVACVIGTGMAIAATGSVTLGLVASLTLCWCFVVAIQVAAAWAIVARAPGRTLPVARAIDTLFASHVPWSLWVLGSAAWIGLTPPGGRSLLPIYVAALIPLARTPVLIYRFCRRHLGDSPRGAGVRTAAHQAIVWAAAIVVGGAAVGLWPRVLQMLGQ